MHNAAETGMPSSRMSSIGKFAWALVALLAILKTGAAYVPLALDAPRARLKTILQALRKAADGADPF